MARLSEVTFIGSTVNEIWWIGVLQGILAIFFGVTAIFWPGLTLVTLVYLFSAFIIALGMIEIVHGLISVRRRGTWWLTLLIGLVGLGVGLFFARNPNVSFNTFILVVGITFIVRGTLDALRAFIDTATTANRILLLIISVAAIAAGIIILLQPVSGGLAFVWVLGLYALIYGLLTTAISFELRQEWKSLLEAADPTTTTGRARA